MIKYLQDAGLEIIDFTDEQIRLTPVDKITDRIKEYVTANKAEIIEELKANLKPSWCTLCNNHSYKFIENRETLYCKKSQQAVCKLKKCELNYWIKDGDGQPVTIH